MTTKQITKNFALLYVSPVTGRMHVAGEFDTTRAANISRTAMRKRGSNTAHILYCRESANAVLAEENQ
jgi:hypothetical protein